MVAGDAGMVNYTNVASNAQLPRQTIKILLQIFEDGLLGQKMPAFKLSTLLGAKEMAKFYFFDVVAMRAPTRLALTLSKEEAKSLNLGGTMGP